MSAPRFRFAPSPNGYLHCGHAYSALYTWHAARRAGGEVLLRIEDIDVQRCKPHFTRQIFDDLAWLGLSWPEPVRVQSQHFDDYRHAAAQLQQAGLLYRCFCSRKEIAAGSHGRKDPDGAPVYNGACRHLNRAEQDRRILAGEPFALRLDMSAAIEKAGMVEGRYSALSDWGDVVLVRKDIPTSYHLSVVVDDALQGITHVTRGMDMFAATAIHIVLQNLLNLPTPHYDHHRLISDETGRKLSKSFADKSLKSLREEGVKARDLIKELGF